MSVLSTMRMQPPFRLAPLKNVRFQQTQTVFQTRFGPNGPIVTALPVIQFFPERFPGDFLVEKLGYPTLVKQSPPRLVLPPVPSPTQLNRYYVYHPDIEFVGTVRVVTENGVKTVYMTPEQSRWYESTHLIGIYPWPVLTYAQRQVVAGFYRYLFPADLPPVVSQPLVDKTGTVNTPITPYTFAANTFADPDDPQASLTYSAFKIATNGSDTALPTGITFNPSTRTFAGTPTQAGVHNIRVYAMDPWGRRVADVFTLTVSP